MDRILGEAANLSGASDFDPAKAVAEITLLSTAYINRVAITHRLRRGAPDITLTVRSGYGDTCEVLLKGKANLATLVGVRNASGLHVRHKGVVYGCPRFCKDFLS
ncbi:hypothetical protein AAFO90_24065 [Phaeobacter sp. CAU 1743]|uniref:hypothetical protein n=1 Tax=Phaeobacter sp. CAU 1743 TaxID=3140367 RepID=UPI00325BE3C5